MTPLPSVSLFSNCGAGDIGYAQAGFTFEVMAELDERRLSVALLNHPTATGVPGDLRETLPAVVSAYRTTRGKARLALLAACPLVRG
jgi:DNA (cytosine-5)-methyltransferase 1